MIFFIIITAFVIGTLIDRFTKISKYFMCISFWHKKYLQKRIFSSFWLLSTHSPEKILMNLYEDLIETALPKVMIHAKKGDRIILRTYLLKESFFEKLPSSPSIRPIFPFDRLLVIITVIIADIFRTIIFLYRKYICKEKPEPSRIQDKSNIKTLLMNRLKRIKKISVRRSYEIIWKKG